MQRGRRCQGVRKMTVASANRLAEQLLAVADKLGPEIREKLAERLRMLETCDYCDRARERGHAPGCPWDLD